MEETKSRCERHAIKAKSLRTFSRPTDTSTHTAKNEASPTVARGTREARVTELESELGIVRSRLRVSKQSKVAEEKVAASAGSEGALKRQN